MNNAIVDTLIPLLFGMGMVVLALFGTYGVHKCLVFATGQGEDAPLQALIRTGRIVFFGGILLGIWMSAVISIFNGINIVGFLAFRLG